MNLLLLPYLLNILMLIPVATLTLFGGTNGCHRVFQGKFPDSEGIRTILGSLWTAILIGSILGLFFPVSMSPLLILQVIYKSLWLAKFALPRLLAGRGNEVPSGVAVSFAVIVATYPWVIPWGQVFGG
jgi:hypothetical protein